MLVGRTIAIVALVALGAGNVLSQPPPPGGWKHIQSQQTKPEQPRQPSSADERGTEKSPLVIKILPTTHAQNKPEGDKSKTHEEPPDDWRSPEGIIAIFTVTLAGIAFLQLIVFGIQACELRRTVTTLVATERPHLFIVIDSSRFDDVVIGEQVLHSFERANANWMVSYFFKNYGKTPAIIKETSHVLTHAVSLPLKAEYIPLNVIESDTAVPSGGPTIARTAVLMNAMTKTEYADVLRGHRTVWFYGRVVYDDLLGGKDHEHRFLWRYHGGSHGFRPHEYGDYNKNT